MRNNKIGGGLLSAEKCIIPQVVLSLYRIDRIQILIFQKTSTGDDRSSEGCDSMMTISLGKMSHISGRRLGCFDQSKQS